MSCTPTSRSTGPCTASRGVDRLLDYPRETFGARKSRPIDDIVEVRPR